MNKNYYWSVALTPQNVSVSLWTREDSETSIVAISSEVPVKDEGEYVSAIDSALSSLAADVPEEAHEPNKVVFGVLSSWVSEGAIKKEKLLVIREVCSTLELSPVGFVVFSESLAYWVKQEEGGPLTGVVIAINKLELEVTLFKLGTAQGTINVGRSASISEDVSEALTRFGSSDPFPSRFLILGDSDSTLSDASSELSNADWTELSSGSLSFLHNPKVEIINARDLLIAISVASSSEMGPITNLVIPEKDPEISKEHANIKNADLHPNELGFVLDADISKLDKEDNRGTVSFEPEISSHDHVVSPVSKKFFLKAKLASFIKRLYSIKGLRPVKPHKAVSDNFSHSLGRSKQNARKKMVIAGIVFVALPIGFILAWYFLPNAEVTIFISPRSLTTSDSFTLKTDITEPDLDKRLLPVNQLTKKVSGQDSASTTGVKTVGEKAQGKVTIRNGTSSGIKIPGGALLTGPNDLKFTVNESASVSAAQSPSTPGELTVSATAASIGSEFNISENTSLTVGSFSKSEIDAVVVTAFTGGSSRQINAVSKGDLDGLEKNLTQSLTDKAKEELSSEVQDGDNFIPDSVKVKVSEKTFDRKVGDEGDTINLSLSLDASGISIPKKALDSLAVSLLSNQVPSGFTFRPEAVGSSFTIEGSNNSVAKVSLNANLLPNVSPDDVSRAIKGKSMTRAQEYLSTIPGFVKAAITIRPSFPSFLKILPWIVNHITVSVEAIK